MTKDDIEELAEAALNAACLCIQEKLGVESGDTAAQVFSGDHHDKAIAMFAEYIRTELWINDNFGEKK